MYVCMYINYIMELTVTFNFSCKYTKSVLNKLSTLWIKWGHMNVPEESLPLTPKYVIDAIYTALSYEKYQSFRFLHPLVLLYDYQ
jgi:hypothetical protein